MAQSLKLLQNPRQAELNVTSAFIVLYGEEKRTLHLVVDTSDSTY
jgi:hypothetical protein